MLNLIDRDALIQNHCGACANKKFCAEESCPYYEIRRRIETAPTIEAEPVKQGQWINNTFCSECKRFPVDVSVPISNQELTKYFSRCPHCGARMKQKE